LIKPTRGALDCIFNWKKSHTVTFLLAPPLAGLCIALILLRAVLEIYFNGDWVYLGITVFFSVLGYFALLPAYRLHKALAIREQSRKEGKL